LKNRILLGIASILLLAYCGEKQETEPTTVKEGFTQVSFTKENSGYVLADTLNNGLIIYAVKRIQNADGTNSYTTRGSQYFSSESNVSSTNNTNLLTLSNGDWFFYGAGFTGQVVENFQTRNIFGTTYCGLVNGDSSTASNAVSLSGGTQSLSMTFSTANCGNPIFGGDSYRSSGVGLYNTNIRFCNTQDSFGHASNKQANPGFDACKNATDPSSGDCNSICQVDTWKSTFVVTVGWGQYSQSTYAESAADDFFTYSNMVSSSSFIKQCYDSTSGISEPYLSINVGDVPFGNPGTSGDHLLNGFSPFSFYVAMTLSDSGSISCSSDLTNSSYTQQVIQFNYGMAHEENSIASSLEGKVKLYDGDDSNANSTNQIIVNALNGVICGGECSGPGSGGALN
jgi:hypothetical protein